MNKLDNFLFADLLLTAVLAPLAFGTVEDWSLALFELNALLLALLLAGKFAFVRNADWRGLHLAWPLLALLLLAVVQAWTLSFDVYATRLAAMKLLALLIYFIAALHLLRDAQRRRRLLIVLTVLGASVAVFAIIQKLTWNGKFYWVRPAGEHVAPFGPFANYNHFAGMMELLLPLPFAHALFARSEAGQRALWFFAVVLMAAALLFSLSRGGMLAFGVQLAALLWLAWRLKAAEFGKPVIVVGVVVLIAVFALWLGYERLLWRFQSIREGANEYSVVTRLEYWRAAQQMFRAHSLTGVGLGAFPAVYPQYGHSSAKLERLEQAHNDYLQLLAETGVIGGALLLWFVIAVLGQAWRQWRQFAHLRSRDRVSIIGGYLAVFGIAVHSLFDFNLQIAANALLFLLVLALVSAHGEGQKRADG